MRIRNDTGEEAFPIAMTNMIDVMLIVLIFFLAASRIAQDERESKVQLPGTASIRPLSAPSKDFIINILQDGTVRVSNVNLTGAQLQAELTKVAKNDPDRNVLVRADERSFMKYFAAVAATARAAGISQLKIGYVLEKPNP